MQPRLSTPRVPPLTDAEMTEEQRQLIGDLPSSGLNVLRTVLRYPAVFKAWGPLAAHIMTGSLSPRDREILILRAGIACNSAYEVAQHTIVSRLVGLSEAEIQSIKTDGTALSAFEQTLVKAADELVHDHFITDATWAALATRYSNEQIVDVIFTVANYTLVSMTLNSLGVQIEPDTEKFWPKAP